MEGRGILNYPDGSSYEGDFKNAKFEGKGILRCTSRYVYEGDFKDGKCEGEGTLTYANGNVYEGHFKDGKRGGKGIMHYVGGTIYEGDFQDDTFEGKGTLSHANGTIVRKGNFKNGKKDGNMRVITRLHVGIEYYVNGVRNKASGVFNNNGITFVANVVDGKAEGKCRLVYPGPELATSVHNFKEGFCGGISFRDFCKQCAMWKEGSPPIPSSPDLLVESSKGTVSQKPGDGAGVGVGAGTGHGAGVESGPDDDGNNLVLDDAPGTVTEVRESGEASDIEPVVTQLATLSTGVERE